MRKFKRIYFAVAGVIAVLLFTLTLVDLGGVSASGVFDTDGAAALLPRICGTTPRSVYDTAEHDRVTKEIMNALTESGIEHNTANADYDAKGAKITGTSDVDSGRTGDAPLAAYNLAPDGGRLPTWYVQEGILQFQDYAGGGYSDYAEGGYSEDDAPDELNAALWPMRLRNVIVAFPAAQNPDTAATLLITAHYDGPRDGEGAFGSALSTVAMLTAVKRVKESGASYSNNIVFLFADGGEEGHYGASLARRFRGFEGVLTRGENENNIGFAVAFGGGGTSGTDILVEAGGGGYAKSYVKAGGGAYANSLTAFIADLLPVGTNLSTFDAPGLGFANIGGAQNAGGQNDSAAAASGAAGRRLLSSRGNTILRVIERFGNSDLAEQTAGGGAVFFSYLNFMTVWYPTAVAFVLAALIIGVLACVVAFNINKRAFSFKKAGFGAIAQLSAVVGGVGLMYCAYYLFALLAAAFGALDIHALGSAAFSSPFLVICALALSALFSALVINVLKRVFKIRAADVVNGSCATLCAAAVILSFAYPPASFLLSWLALLEGGVWLATVLLKDAFKRKFGFGMERLFLPVIPLILSVPVTLAAAVVAGGALGAFRYPLISVIALLNLGFITPYFSYLKPVLAGVFAKLPPLRVRRAVIENAAPEKGKKQPPRAAAPVKRYIIEKKKIEYGNPLGFGILGFVMFAVLFISVLAGGSASAAVSRAYDPSMNFYKDMLVYVKTNRASGDSKSNYWMIKDLDAYRYMKGRLEGYSWDAGKAAYVKYDDSAYSMTSSTPSCNYSGSAYNDLQFSYWFYPSYSGYSSYNVYYTLTIDNSDGMINEIGLYATETGSASRNIVVKGIDTVVLTLKDSAQVTFYTNSREFDKNRTVDYREYVGNANVENAILATDGFRRYDAEQLKYVNEYGDLRAAVNNAHVRGGIVFDYLLTLPERSF